MSSSLSINSPSFTRVNSTLYPPRSSSATPILRPPLHRSSRKTIGKTLTVKAASSKPAPSEPPNIKISPLKTAACAAIFAAAAFGKFPTLPARAEVSTPPETLTEVMNSETIRQEEETMQQSPLSQLLESSPEAIDSLKKLLLEKLEAGEDEESLSILRKLSSAQPDDVEWKFLIARVLNEMGKLQEARDAFEEILAKHPLSFEALFQNALLMDRSGDGEAVMSRLEEALRVAEVENKMKEARDVKLIMAQMKFVHKKVDEALKSYDELVKEDPSDFRPYFCKGIIFILLDRKAEAEEQFAKFRDLSPENFEVEGFLRTPLSKMKLFGTDEEN